MANLSPPQHTQSSLNIQDGASESALTEQAICGAGANNAVDSTSRVNILRTASAYIYPYSYEWIIPK